LVTEKSLSFTHRFIPGDDGARVTLLLLHGTGATEDDLLPLGRELSPGAHLLSPRGKVLENGMPRFFRRLRPGVYDVEDLMVRTHELAGFVREASSAYGLDSGNIWGVGFSNGANIAASMLLLHPAALRGAILFKPMLPVELEVTPQLEGKPVFIAAGRFDQLVDAGETEKLVDLFRRADADVATHWKDGGHELTADEVDAARVWLSERIPSEVSPD
jgi:phospholipase/carboxylesterase